MKSSTKRELRVYHRNAIISFACIVICIVLDVVKYTQAGQFSFDRSFIFSIVLYILLAVLGAYSIKKANKIKKND